jgi:protein-tyrosine phosphatase
MAEAFLRDKIKQSGLEHQIVASSAGIAAGGQYPASGNACLVMRQWGLELTEHYSRQLLPEHIVSADLILTMTDRHKKVVISLVPAIRHRIYTLAEYALEDGEITDPYGGSVTVYQACAKQIAKIVDKAWVKIVALAGKKDSVEKNDR